MLATLRSSRLVAALAILAWAGSVQANGISVRITEVQSSSGVGGTNDWFEITNYGSTAVDITGWRMDDSSASFATSFELKPFAYPTANDPAWFLLEPGESAVMLEVTTLTPATQVLPFQTFWNLGTGSGNIRNAKIATYAGSGISFSSGGDGVVVFDSAGNVVVPLATFGAATTGSTFYWSYDAAGQMATAAGGTVSVPGVANAYSSGTPTNIGSPGIAVVASPTVSRYWTANGSSLGGSGTWTTAGTNWSPAQSPVTATTWQNGAAAVFDGTPGTVTVNAAVAPLGISFITGGYTLAAGSGSITTPSIDVASGQSATVAAKLTGSAGLTLLGGGTLRLSGTANDYTGATSVGVGTLVVGANEVIPDASRLTVSRFMNADLSGYSETVNGIAGLGTVTIGNALTVNITGSADVVIDGFLRGTGDFIVDSAGTGAQRLDASTQTLGDGAVKDYTGATIVRRGTLKVHFDGIPTQTSGVDVEAAGILRLESSGQTYTFANNPALPVNLKGGTLGQGTGDDVTLANPVNVTADSTFSILNTVSPDLANPTTEQMILTGALTGTAGRTITITASNTTPGADKGRVAFGSASGNTFAGTVKPQVNAVARFTGNYAGVAVALDQGKLDGSGIVGAVSGTGTISPAGDFGPGILTAASITTSATTAFEFDFNTANADPVWFSPTASENDVLRLTGATPLPNALGAGNVVRLFLNVGTLAATDTFTGGFFTTANSTASIVGGAYQTYVLGDGLGTDYTHDDIGWYSLANYATQQGTTLGTTITMAATTALFDGFTPTAGYVMELSLSGDPPPPPGPLYTGGFVVNPAVGDNEDIPWGTVAAWQPTGPTEGLTVETPRAGDSITVNKLTEGRRNVDLGGPQAVGDIASTVDGNENAQTNGGVRFRGGVLTLDTGDGSESLVTYSGTGNGRLEFRFDALGERLAFANDVRVEADNTAGRVDIRGTVSGSDTLTKAGPGELRFTATFDETSGANLFNATGLTGAIVVEQGVLTLGDQVTLPSVASVSVANGGQLRLAGAATGATPFAYAVGSGTISLAGSGRSGVADDSGLGVRGALRYEPAVASQAVVSNALALPAAADIHAAGGSTLTLSGAVTGTGGITKSGGGTLVFDAANGYSGPTRIDTGRLTLAAAGTVAASPLVAVGEGATFDVSAKAGGYAVPAGQTLAGSGTVDGSVAIGTAATLAPGASPGTLTVSSNVTLGSGGNYNWQVYDASGTAGSTTGWDLLSVGGGLDIAATSGSRFNINLWSLSGVGPDVNGSAVNFNSAQNGSWRIASAAGGITGFAADKFAVNTAATNGTAGFANDLAGGTFAVVQQGNDLVLQFTADAPEPVAPVKITGVYVKGSAWNAGYLARTPFATVEGATVGWELPDGSAQLANASNVAWNNVDTITVQFDQPIAQPDAAALQLVRGTASGNESIVPALAPTLLGDGSAAQWTLPAGFATLQRGKYVLSIAADGITNAAGTTILDGDWITSVSTFAEGSGDGEAGGAFNFFFNALVGDVNGDGVMNVSDLSAVRNALTSPLNTPLAANSSNYRLDINGSNSLSSADISQTRAQLTSALGTQLASLPAVTAPAEGMTASGLTVAPVPEPGSLGLLAGGLAALLALGVRRRKAWAGGLRSPAGRPVATIPLTC
jgi:autotransporter-associated beta strand protein